MLKGVRQGESRTRKVTAGSLTWEIYGIRAGPGMHPTKVESGPRKLRGLRGPGLLTALVFGAVLLGSCQLLLDLLLQEFLLLT